MNIGAIAGGLCVIVGAAIFFIAFAGKTEPRIKCTFDRNETGPKGEYGQWYWEIYKCEDGTERRVLVASPRG